MTEACTVDAELFDSLEEAIAFVGARGGGVVYTEAADSEYGKSLILPDNVRLEPARPSVAA